MLPNKGLKYIFNLSGYAAVKLCDFLGGGFFFMNLFFEIPMLLHLGLALEMGISTWPPLGGTQVRDGA